MSKGLEHIRSAVFGSGEMGRTQPPVGDAGVGQAGHTGMAAHESIASAERGVMRPVDAEATSGATPVAAAKRPVLMAEARVT